MTTARLGTRLLPLALVAVPAVPAAAHTERLRSSVTASAVVPAVTASPAASASSAAATPPAAAAERDGGGLSPAVLPVAGVGAGAGLLGLLLLRRRPRP